MHLWEYGDNIQCMELLSKYSKKDKWFAILNAYILKSNLKGTWTVQSVEYPILDFSSDHDFRVLWDLLKRCFPSLSPFQLNCKLLADKDYITIIALYLPVYIEWVQEQAHRVVKIFERKIVLKSTHSQRETLSLYWTSIRIWFMVTHG